MGTVDQTFLAITCADGSTSLMGFVIAERNTDGSTRWSKLATRENVEAIIVQSALSWAPEKLPVQSWRFVSEAERAMYEQREFRDALRDTAGVISHHMPTAREIQRERMRVARVPLLEALDVAYMQADEAADVAAKVSIAAQKRALRDVTDDAAIEAAQTPEELTAAWPAILMT